jgi:putative SOS response-associated peptidase YedK
VLPNNWRTNPMCNLYSITTNQEAIRALFRVVNRHVGNLPPMPGVFPAYPAPVVRNASLLRSDYRGRQGGRQPRIRARFGGRMTIPRSLFAVWGAECFGL